MPRKGHYREAGSGRRTQIYNSTSSPTLVNSMMWDGKKRRAKDLLYRRAGLSSKGGVRRAHALQEGRGEAKPVIE